MEKRLKDVFSFLFWMSTEDSSGYVDSIISVLRESGQFDEDELGKIEESLQFFLV